MKQEDKKTVLVYGTFDRLHNGHRFFLKQAKTLGNFLVVIVAQPVVIRRLKGRQPKHSLRTRISRIRQEKLADKVVAGETKINSWQAIAKYQPEIVALGHDQKDLKKALKAILPRFPFLKKIQTLKAHPDKTLHSRFLREN